VRAVNLIPSDSRRGGGRQIGRTGGGVYLVLGVLAAALALVVVYVLSSNTIADREAKIAELQAQATQAQADAARLTPYTQFAQLAQARAATVRQIAATRFDWHQSLSDLSKVVPANTSLQSLVASVAPGAAGGGGGGGGVALRSQIASPAFELTGCTSTQDDVARLISRLRLMSGVTRVSLQDSVKADAGQSGTSVSSAGTSAGAQGCGSNTPTFHVVAFFKPLAGAAASATTPGAAQTVAQGTTTGVGATPTPSGSSTPVSTTTPAATTTAGGSK
jgi:Tfp pilus assembly protein PilN